MRVMWEPQASTLVGLLLCATPAAQVGDPFAHSVEFRSTTLNGARRTTRQSFAQQQPDLARAARHARRWLIQSQRADGTWPAGLDYELGTTGLAMLALMADGVTLRTGEQSARSALKRGVRWLRDRLDRSTGRFCRVAAADRIDPGVEPLRPDDELQQTIAALALAEAFAVSDYTLIKRPAMAATQRVGSAARRWPTRRGEQPPMTSWQVLVAAVARGADLPLHDDSAAAAESDPLVSAPGATIAERATAFALSRLLLEAPGIRTWFRERADTRPGQRTPSPDLPEGERTRLADLVSAWRPRFDAANRTERIAEWPNHALAIAHLSPAHAKLLRDQLDRSILPVQRTDEAATDAQFVGSWDPMGKDGHAAGRAFTTAAILLTLQAAHRYPIQR